MLRAERSCAFTLLAVIGLRTMFPEVMLVVQGTADRARVSIDSESEVCHARHRFEYYRIVCGADSIRAPGKGTMVCNQHGWNVVRKLIAEDVDNRSARIFLVGTTDLF